MIKPFEFLKPDRVCQKITKEDLAHVLAHYDWLNRDWSFEPLYGGYRNTVFKIMNTSMVYVFILYQPDGFSKKDRKIAVEVENWAAANTLLNARSVIKNKNGEDLTRVNLWGKKRLVALFHYVPGEPVFPYNKAQIVAAGQLLSNLHLFLKDCPLAPSLKVWEKTASFKKSQVLHLDFGRANVLYRGEKAVGIIDFETVARGPIEADLARTLSFLFVDTPLDFGEIKEAFLEGYFSAQKTQLDQGLLNRLTIYFLEKIKNDLGKTFSSPKLSAHRNFVKANQALRLLKEVV